MTDTQQPHNGGERGGSVESMRQFFTLWLEQLERFLEERDRRYTERFAASETAVNAALVSAKDAVAAALASQEKAGSKAEAAQQSYNERSNEFRGQLDDQAKRLMPREETMLLIRTIEDKMESERANGAARLDEVKTQIAQLRESRSQVEGRQVQVAETRQSSQFSTTTLIAVAFGLVGVFGVVISIAVSVAISVLGK